MLFPGLERSQRLLEDVVKKHGRSNAQERTHNDENKQEGRVLHSNLFQSDKRNQNSTNSSEGQQKQNPVGAPAQNRAKFEDGWPNGKPPTAPRRHLQRNGQCSLKWQPTASGSGHGPVAEASSYSRKLEGQSQAVRHHISRSKNLVTASKLDNINNGSESGSECLKGANNCTSEEGRNIGPVRDKTDLKITATATKRSLMDERKQSPHLLPQSDIELSEHSASRIVSLPGEINAPQAPRSPSRLPPIANETYVTHTMGLGATSPKCPVRAETSILSSPLGLQHRDIASVIKHRQRSSSEAVSVASSTESVAGKSSSSSISSTLRRSICHICKKRPFRERLKGCFKCSRHYHKGCAKPKDRITENDWVCRRCLNKLAKKSGTPLSSGSQPGFSAQPECSKELGEVPTSALIPCSTATTSNSGLTPAAYAMSLPASHSEVSHHNKQVGACKPLKAGTQVNKLIASNHRSSNDALHCFGPSNSTPALVAVGAKNTTNAETVMGSVNVSSVDVSSPQSWPTKNQGLTTATDHLHEPKDPAPSSPSPAPSLGDRKIPNWTIVEQSVLTEHPNCSECSGSYHCHIPYDTDHPTCNIVQHHTLLRPKALITQKPSAESDDSTSSGIRNSYTDGDYSSRVPGKLIDDNHCSSNERPKSCQNQPSVDVSESLYVLTPPAQPPDSAKATGVEIPCTAENPPGIANNENGSDGVPPVKKLCIHCQRLIFGSTSMCTKCRQMRDEGRHYRSEEECSKKHSVSVALPITTMNSSRRNSCLSFASDEDQYTIQEACQRSGLKGMTCGEPTPEVSPTETFHFQNDTTNPLTTRSQSGVSDSPFNPQIPEFVSRKTSRDSCIPSVESSKPTTCPPRLPKPLVPQKRPQPPSAVTDNEHCFSKKKPRIYKDVSRSISVKVPPVSLNKYPPTPQSTSSHIENYARDVAVQTSVETVHKGTTPGAATYEAPDTLSISKKTLPSPAVRSDQATASRKEDVFVGVGPQCKVESFSPRLGRKSGKWQTKTACRALEQQAGKLEGRNQEHHEADARQAHLQGLDPESTQSGKQETSGPVRESSVPKYDEELPSNSTINPCHRQIGTPSNWTSSNEKILMKSLQSRGVIFEEDSSGESDIGMPPPRIKPIPKDPLWQRPQSSRDLFMIAPRLATAQPSFDVEQKRKEIAARPPRKKRRLNMPYLRQERGDNIHEEVERIFPPRMVKVSSMVVSELADSADRHADWTGFERLPEMEMTFGAFIGAPAVPMAILTKHKQLAFRDGTRDVKGNLPRAREKFILTNKSVGSTER